jgi:hypothetical protein
MTFTDLRHFPSETQILGGLLSGYGDLELNVAFLLQFVPGGSHDAAIKTVFGVRGETARIEVADNQMRRHYVGQGLSNEYGEAIGAVRHCLKIRNQYAHCSWVRNLQNGLCFVDLEEVAKREEQVDLTELSQRRVSLALLQEQEAFFAYTLGMLTFLNFEFRARTGQLPTNPRTSPSKPPRRPPRFLEDS